MMTENDAASVFQHPNRFIEEVLTDKDRIEGPSDGHGGISPEAVFGTQARDLPISITDCWGP
jgi:hypothetical protein